MFLRMANKAVQVIEMAQIEVETLLFEALALKNARPNVAKALEIEATRKKCQILELVASYRDLGLM